jgi:predicted MFS family arabinose efflux permease
MVGPSELPNAVALNASLFNAARVVGPALGGIVVAAAGAGWCFAANSITFLAVLAGLLAMRVGDLLPLDRPERPPVLSGTREALVHARRSPLVAMTLLLVFFVSTFAFNFNVLLPVLARETLDAGPEVFGVLSACFGAGALVGALTSATLGRASLRTLLLGTGLYGAAQLVLAPLASLALCCALIFLIGFAFTTWSSNSNSLLQLTSSDQMRGRVLGLYFYAFLGGAPLGGLVAGWLAAAGGTDLAFAFSGTVTLVASALVYLRLRPGTRVPFGGQVDDPELASSRS